MLSKFGCTYSSENKLVKVGFLLEAMMLEYMVSCNPWFEEVLGTSYTNNAKSIFRKISLTHYGCLNMFPECY
jgi:hypothetical protein